MTDASEVVFANRDEPIPSLIIPGLETAKHEHTQVLSESSDGEGKRAHLKGKLKENLPGVKGDDDRASGSPSGHRPSMQDRLFAR